MLSSLIQCRLDLMIDLMSTITMQYSGGIGVKNNSAPVAYTTNCCNPYTRSILDV